MHVGKQNNNPIFTRRTFGSLLKKGAIAVNVLLHHGLRTPNEGTNLRYLKKWADVADKICCRHT